MLLGETPIDAPRRSVFEYMSAENKNRLDSILGIVLDTDGDKSLKRDYFEVPKIEKSSAEAALKGFMPFGDNLAKQSRYKQYLNIQAGQSDETIALVEGFSGADMTKELHEFVQAARIFKPLSSTMSSRFTTASKVIEFAQPAAGLRSAADIKASAADKSSPMHAVVERMEIPVSLACSTLTRPQGFSQTNHRSVDYRNRKRQRLQQWECLARSRERQSIFTLPNCCASGSMSRILILTTRTRDQKLPRTCSTNRLWTT